MMKIAIAGAGVMGSGIALCSITSGYDTILFDIQPDAVARGKSYIEKELHKSLEKGKLTQEQITAALSHLNTSHAIDDLKADLIIEAVVEKLEVKQDLFRKLEAINSPECILATNTSSIPVTRIAAALQHPERFVGIHFFNPAHIMKLVEIISGVATDAQIAQKSYDWAVSLGKKAVFAADAPGFIVNRVARHYYVESLKIMEESVADFESIDRLCEASGFKMGPFRLMDLIGVETNYSVTSSMFELFNYDAKFRPSRIQKQKADAGHHGRKTGQGFYKY